MNRNLIASELLKAAKEVTAADRPYAMLIFRKSNVGFSYRNADGNKGRGSEPYGRDIFKAMARVEETMKKNGILGKDVEVLLTKSGKMTKGEEGHAVIKFGNGKLQYHYIQNDYPNYGSYPYKGDIFEAVANAGKALRRDGIKRTEVTL